MSLALWARAAMAGAAMADDEVGQSFPLGTRSENAQGLTITMRNQAGDRLIDKSLVAGGATAYLIDMQIGLFGGNYSRLRLGTSTHQSGTSSAGGPDLTGQFESNWELTLRHGGDEWAFNHTEFSPDSSEPYSWLTSSATVQARLKAARDALRNTNGGTVTLHDGSTGPPATPARQTFNLGARSLLNANFLLITVGERINANLVAGGGTAYVVDFGLIQNQGASREYSLLLGVYSGTTRQVGRDVDLTSQFEDTWEITITLGTTSWEFDHSQFTEGSDSPYTWKTTNSAVQQRLLTAFNALRSSTGGTVTLDNGVD